MRRGLFHPLIPGLSKYIDVKIIHILVVKDVWPLHHVFWQLLDVALLALGQAIV